MEETNILLVRDYYPSESTPSDAPQIHYQAVGAKKRGVNTFVISPTPYVPFFHRKKIYIVESHLDVRYYDEIPIIRPQFFKIPNHFLYRISFRNLSRAVEKSGTKINFDIIHAHFGQNGAASLQLKKKTGAPLITTFYGFDSGIMGKRLFGRYYKDLANLGDLFLVLSKDMKKDLIAMGFPENKIQIHRIGVNLNQWKPSEEKNNNFMFLNVSRFNEKKGVHHTIEAFSQVYKKRKDIDLVILGDGPYKNKLERMISDLDLKSRIKIINNFASSNPREMVKEYMSKCDAFVLNSFTSSTGQKEGTPAVLMEAHASSKPCISTKHAGISDVVLDGETGFLVNEKDIDATASKMLDFVKDRDMCYQMGIKGRRHMEKEFDNSKLNDKLVDIYKKLGVS